MGRALQAGALYFILVFSAGFVLGTIRTIVLVPSIGPLAAVAVELPFMLAIAWFASRAILRRLRGPQAGTPRLVMGAFAFALLILAEVALAVFGFGLPVGDAFAAMTTPAGLLGLAGQVAFALIPALMREP